MAEASLVQKLEETATRCRVSILRMLEKAKSGHPGGSLSVIDLIVALFFHEMKHDPQKPRWDERDRFVLSKGHGVPALYAALVELGAFPEAELDTLRMIDSRLQGHPDRVVFPWAEASTGSLGQGLSIAQGIALGLKSQGKPNRVFCVIGDGESQEGQIWEAAMSAPKFKLNNLIAFTDANNGQIDGHVTEVMDLRPLAEKWKSFRWAVQEIDGHDFSQILDAVGTAKKEKERPSMIIARTVKGKGVSFMENNIGWHGVAPNAEQLEQATSELLGGRNER
jgi:transketolase